MAHFGKRGQPPIELVLAGRMFTERHGDVTASRELHDERAARIAYYRRIGELLEDGWIRTSDFEDDLLVVEEPSLVAAIDAGDREALAVYTDWLLERGDPRGEYAVMLKSNADPRAIASLAKTRGVELFGPLAMLGRHWREDFDYVVRDGWVDEVVFHRGEATPRPSEREVMQHAMFAPVARFVRWLTVDGWYEMTLYECLAAERWRDRVRGIRFTSHPRAGTLELLPNLEEIELLDDDQLGGGHTRVRRLRLTTDYGPAEVTGEWPSLRRLEIVAKREIGLFRGVFELLEIPSVTEVVIEAPPLGNSELTRRLEAFGRRFDVFELKTRA